MSTDFPASPETPGQAKSRVSFNALQARAGDFAWWNDFQAIRRQFAHFKNWRVYVYIAWAGQPANTRQPRTETDLAGQVLGCTPRSIHNWKRRTWGEGYPTIDEAIAWAQALPLLQSRRQIYDALTAVAKRDDPRAHQDRKLALELLGDYVPRQKLDTDLTLPQLPGVLNELMDKIYGNGDDDSGADDAAGDQPTE